MNEIEQILDAMLARNDVSAEKKGDTYTVEAGEITLVLEELHFFLHNEHVMECLLAARAIKVGSHGTHMLQEVSHEKYYTRIMELVEASRNANYDNVLELAARKLGIQKEGDNR